MSGQTKLLKIGHRNARRISKPAAGSIHTTRSELPFDTLAEIVGNAPVSDPLNLLSGQGQAKKLAKNVSPKALAIPRWKGSSWVMNTHKRFKWSPRLFLAL